MVKAIRISVFLALAVALAVVGGCASEIPIEDRIEGRWVSATPPGEVDFDYEGNFGVRGVGGKTALGNYVILEDETVLATFTYREYTGNWSFRLEGDELVLNVPELGLDERFVPQE